MDYLRGLQDKYVNPFTDFGFKKLFGTEPNKDLLINFLNEVVLPDSRKIEDLQYRSSEQLGMSELDRKAIFDLYCVGTNGERFIVEMQKAHGSTLRQNFFVERSVYYASFPIQEQGLRGGWSFDLAEVYTVGILDFVFQEDKKEQRVRHEIKLKDQDCQVFYDKLTFIYLEMPNFTKTESELETTYDKWLYVLKHLPDLEKRPQKLQERVFEKLFEAAELAKFKPEERQAYENSLKVYRDLNNVIETANTKGMEKGMAIGIEQGMGIFARNCIREGMPSDTIVRLTGLTEAQIQHLRDTMP